MSEYTTEENQELIETIKRPIRHYRIHLWGYGGESSYINLTKEAYNFWKPIVEENGDSDLVHYMVEAENGEFEFEEIETVPDEADFMKDADGDYRPWYESPNEFEHQYGVDFSSARLTIEEVENEEYNSSVIDTVVDGEELNVWTDAIQSEDNYETEIVEMGVSEGEDTQGDYICQFYSSEKGTFFDGIFTTIGPFDPKKIKFYTEEFLNGDDTVLSITYNGEEIENQGGDTNGKGYSAHLWSNVQ